MGIPWYFKKIVDTYPDAIVHDHVRVDLQTVNECRLFLDYNGIIHQCVQLMNNGQGQGQGQGHVQPTNMDEEKLVKRVWTYTLEVIEAATKGIPLPITTVFIGIDGMAPMAKIVQQRKRRFLSLWEKNKILDESRKHPQESGRHRETWDTNAITPGTKFMNYLADYLRLEIAKHTVYKISIKQPTIQFILSTSNEVGEGEHKMIAYIREHRGPCLDVIYGLDADLISLALIETAESESESNVWLMREASKIKDHIKEQVPSYLFVDIRQLANQIHHDVQTKYQWNPVRSLRENVLDYIVICFCLGNDFIPGLSYLKIKDGGLETLLRQHGKTQSTLLNLRQSNDSLIGNRDGTDKTVKGSMIDIDGGGASQKYVISYDSLVGLLQCLQIDEQKHLAELHHRYVNEISMKWRGVTNHIQTLPQQAGHKFKHVHKLRLHETGWKTRYYYYLFRESHSSSLAKICTSYVRGLEWCVDYYFNKVFDDEYYYPFQYSPTITDLYQHIVYMVNGQDKEKASVVHKLQKIAWKESSHPMDLLTKLVAVLPPQSILSLMPEYAPICEDVRHGCCHYYPVDFTICTYLKSFTWECYPEIPHVDMRRVRRAIHSLQSSSSSSSESESIKR
jgi:5'-3' exonuclease